MSQQPPAGKFDLVICDIDGCLSPETSGPMNVPALQQVAGFNRRAHHVEPQAGNSGGPVVTLCSGRPQPFVEAMCRLLQNTSTPCIAENGVWMFDPSNNRYEIDPTITPEHLDAVHEASKWAIATFGHNGVVLQPGKSASVTLYHPDPEHLRSICPALREEFARRGWPFRVSMTWFYINCDLNHISKASGVQRLLAATGIARQRTAGIGDTMSDKPIADNTAYFACPANAAGELKALADYVSPHEQTMGVVDILTRLSE